MKSFLTHSSECIWQIDTTRLKPVAAIVPSRMYSAFGLAIVMAVLAVGCASVETARVTPALEAQASAGNTKAQLEMALAYDHAGQNPSDYALAAVWYQKAVDAGSPIAQNNLGSLYQFGLGVPKDLEKARILYAASAAQGFALAENSLGLMYDLGKGGLSQDRTIANSWYRKAAEQIEPEAMLNLGINYWNGYGVEADLVQSYMWLDLARFYTQFSKDMRLKWRCRGALDELSKEMDRASIARAQTLSRAWTEAHQK